MTEPPLPEEPDLPQPDGNPRVNRYGQRGALTPELQERIIRVVSAGNYLKVAAQFCGIGESTLRSWLSRGRKAAEARDKGEEVPEDDARYLAFLEAITRAETTAEVAAVTHWRAAFAEDWRAARDFLVRSKPDRWAATTRVQITQEEADRRIDTAVEQVLVAAGVDVDSLSDDVLSGEVEGLLDGGSLDLDLDDPDDA